MQSASLSTEEARQFTVVRKVPESEEITSFYLRPMDGSTIAEFSPGQYLTLELDVSPGLRVIRTYSISCGPGAKECYRISVKREKAPLGRLDLPDGVGSAYMHDVVRVGHELSIRDPRGGFVLDTTSTRPVLLLSGGVGVTPLLSMLYALANSNDRDVWFIHACRNGRVHAFAEEVRNLVSTTSRIHTHTCYELPDDDDLSGSRCDSSGFIDKSTIQRLVPLNEYNVYMCGPAAFMQAMYDLLTELGVAEDRIIYEFFGVAYRLRPSCITAKCQTMPNAAMSDASELEGRRSRVVTFAVSRLEVAWDDNYASLLEFAEGQGLSPNFSCRAGICSTCECSLTYGEIEYFIEPLDSPAHGRALICCSIPMTDVTLEL